MVWGPTISSDLIYCPGLSGCCSRSFVGMVHKLKNTFSAGWQQSCMKGMATMGTGRVTTRMAIMAPTAMGLAQPWWNGMALTPWQTLLRGAHPKALQWKARAASLYVCAACNAVGSCLCNLTHHCNFTRCRGQPHITATATAAKRGWRCSCVPQAPVGSCTPCS